MLWKTFWNTKLILFLKKIVFAKSNSNFFKSRISMNFAFYFIFFTASWKTLSKLTEKCSKSQCWRFSLHFGVKMCQIILKIEQTFCVYKSCEEFTKIPAKLGTWKLFEKWLTKDHRRFKKWWFNPSTWSSDFYKTEHEFKYGFTKTSTPELKVNYSSKITREIAVVNATFAHKCYIFTSFFLL